MSANPTLRVRRSINELQDEYSKGNKQPLEDLMRAWKGIKELPPEDERSFFRLGGYHGEPFRGGGWGNSAYWGGYCNHGNVLFPTWHRMYLVKLEEALQSIAGCKDVMMAYWDETSADSLKNGIPWALTVKDFVLDGVTIPNPLRSFVFSKPIKDHINGDDPDYSKPKGYETVRYPLSGLVGTSADKAKTEEHNAQFPDYDKNVALLNTNIVNWLTSTVVVKGQVVGSQVAKKYRSCLDAPNFTVFSNTSSSAQWNDERPGSAVVVPLESPHNSMHLAVGGYDAPGFDASPIEGANGDMGENDTAGLDPIFYFHHCFVDRVFWLWQKKHGCTDHLDIIAEYPGTNSVDSQGPTPGTAPNSWLTLESPLNPFKKTEGGKQRPYTSLDCINIEKQLGFTYGRGSLDEVTEQEVVRSATAGKVVRVSGINRAPIRGSFVVSVCAKIDGKEYVVGSEEVLSRWSVKYCANCQTHLEVKSFVSLQGLQQDGLKSLGSDDVYVKIRTRDGELTAGQTLAPALKGRRAVSKGGRALYHIEVR